MCRELVVAAATPVASIASPDPLAIGPCVASEPPVRVDPMLEELVASLVAPQSTVALSLEVQLEPPSPVRMLVLNFAEVGEAQEAVPSPSSPPRLASFSEAVALEVVVGVGSMSAPPDTPTTATPSPVAPVPSAPAPAAASGPAFFEEPPSMAPRRRRRTKVVDDNWFPRRSDRLAAKSAFRDPRPEKQARRVLLNKWATRPVHVAPNPVSAAAAVSAGRFQETFRDAAPPTRRQSVRKLLPLLGVRFAGEDEDIADVSEAASDTAPNPAAAPPTPPAPAFVAPTTSSVEAFIDSLTLPLEEPLAMAPPLLRCSRVVDDRGPDPLDRLRAKSVFRDANPEK